MFARTTTTVLLALVAAASAVQAELKIYSPTTEHYWIGNSTNTLAWYGTTPTEFSVFLANPDILLLTSSMVAITSVTPAYQGSLTIIPTVNPGPNYTVLLVDILNSTNVYATSEPFEIKPPGSLYPTGSISLGRTAPSSTATAAQNGVSTKQNAGTATGASGSEATPSQTGTSGAGKEMAVKTGLGAAMVAAALGGIML